jgi:tetratricopeptide (TPR) repeat protein
LAEQDIAGYAKWRDAALSLNPKNGTFYKDLSDILGFLHLYPEADRILREGAGKAPDDPYVHAALGLNLLRLGDETKALEELGLAWKKDPFNERTRNVLDLYEQSIAKNYALAERGGVTVRLPHDDREFLQPSLLDAVMQSRKTLDAAYKTSSGPLRLEFFREPHEFSVRTVGVPSLGAIAVCFGQVITFIGPYHGMHNIDNVIHHELAHVYAIKKSKGRVPRWFTEGLSEWESEQADPAWARESAELLQQARRAGKLRRLHELELAFIRAESSAMMEVAYSTAAYAIRYLGQTYGRDALVSMLVGYGSGESTDVLVEKHLGKNMATVESEFEQWFFAELDKVVTGWHPASHAKAADERDDLFKRAVRQLQHNDRPAAIHTLEELLARGGDGYASRMLLAQLLLDGPKPVAAQRHLQAAQKFHLEAIDPLVRLAELARKLDRPDDEKSHLRSALAIDGDSLEPAARLLMLAVVTGDRDASSFAFRRAQAIAPLHPIVLAAQALQVAKSDKARARTLFERGAKTLSGPPQGPGDTYVVLALAAAAVGDAAAAKKFAAVARNDPRLPAAARKQLEKF